MAKAAALGTVLPGTKKKGEVATPSMKPVVRTMEEKTKALTVKVNPELYRQLRLHAVDTEMSHQDILVAALEQYLR